MAMVLFKTADQLTKLVEYAKYVVVDGFGDLLEESVNGFVDGRLLGNLGDTPEAMDTGEGKKQQLPRFLAGYNSL